MALLVLTSVARADERVDELAWASDAVVTIEARGNDRFATPLGPLVLPGVDAARRADRFARARLAFVVRDEAGELAPARQAIASVAFVTTSGEACLLRPFELGDGDDHETVRLGPIASVEARAREVCAQHAAFRAVEEEPRVVPRAARLAPFTRSDVKPLAQAALRALARCEHAGVQHLLAILDDATRAREHPDVLRALTAGSCPEAEAEVRRLLRREIDFWRGRAPFAESEWRDPELPRALRRLEALIDGIAEQRLTSCRGLVEELRSFWAETPELTERLGVVGRMCDRALAGLR